MYEIQVEQVIIPGLEMAGIVAIFTPVMDDFANYSYYKGEDECPFKSDSNRRVWWRIESYAARSGDRKISGELSATMIEFLRERVWQSDSGWSTSWETAFARATELYRKGLWSATYISEEKATIEDVR